ncbi:hypothetical protein N7495_000060 [Penicillium taxi]|uniref:uncharacterized protein n=1 Tax=Penicillium taxi TaxID=168475 RepID=UPI002545B627|nr:uncharacterized protein N7495_000060 [Penicillium taxi]KAJ5907378.1 hypothetical protein N7495_000060 [Penicillium taxi]
MDRSSVLTCTWSIGQYRDDTPYSILCTPVSLFPVEKKKGLFRVPVRRLEAQCFLQTGNGLDIHFGRRRTIIGFDLGLVL